MKKAWSFFWLVVAWCVGLTIIAAVVEPYLGVIALVVSVCVIAYIGIKAYRSLSRRSTHY